jgi:hypothetical protein
MSGVVASLNSNECGVDVGPGAVDKNAFLLYALQAGEDSKDSLQLDDERSRTMDTQVPLISIRNETDEPMAAIWVCASLAPGRRVVAAG